jgi:hypothetical protein
MGTNFYWSDDEIVKTNNLVAHIGKRSAAGPYCYDCGTTLCNYGTDFVHASEGSFLPACPFCGTPFERGKASAVAVELGFNQFADVPRTGVATASSFRWRMMRHLAVIRDIAATHPDRVCVVDEYDRTYTASAFLDMVMECPIWNQSPGEFC